jgi:hypothetical protein
MSYTIHKADGTAVTVTDNNADLTHYTGSLPPAVGRGLVLIGRNYINYGAPIAQNLLQITENFASTTSFMPSDAVAMQGQLWFEKDAATNSTNGNLYVRTSSAAAGGSANWKKVVVADSATGGLTVGGDITTTGQFNGSGAGLTNIPNSALVNSSITIGTTAISLGATAASLTGLPSVSAPNLNGAGAGITGVPHVYTVTPGAGVAVVGDVLIAGGTISVHNGSIWKQVFPAVYS